jgi:parallel beta-helix repeat protein/predicted outer membrane repeat protein
MKILLALIIFSPSLATADTIHVPADQPTIQAGIDAAAGGDTVLVAAGTYAENIDFKGKAIVLASETGAMSTCIDGNQNGSVVTFKYGEEADSIIDGFTITNHHGYPTGGYGIHCLSSSPTILNNIIKGGPAGTEGSGIYCAYSYATITNNVIEGNTDSRGAGISCVDASPTIANNTITNNLATSYGGGIYCDYASPVISNNVIEDNIANYEGGGIYCHFLSAPSITGNLIQGNRIGYLYGEGGGILCYNASPSISGNTIKWNEATATGGGIYLDDASPDIFGNAIIENSAAGMGGGIYCDHSSANITDNLIASNMTESGGGICCQDASPTIRRNRITLNAAALEGGGIFCENSYSNIKENRIMDNTAKRGAGIYLDGFSPKIIKNILSDNTSTLEGGGICCNNASPSTTGNIITGNRSDYSGGGIYFYNSTSTIENNAFGYNSADYCGGGLFCSLSTLTVTNNTFTGNTIDTHGGGGICCFAACLVDVANTILWNNSAPTGSQICLLNLIGPSTLNITYSDLEGGKSGVHVDGGCVLRWGYAMIDADPLFVDFAGNDFHLTYDSPCRDVGDNLASTKSHDFEGDPRIAWGGIVDMGADEFHTHLYVTGDKTPGGAIQGKLIGLPASDPVGLFIGSGVLDPSLPTAWGDFHLQAPWILIPLVPIPASGVLALPATIPLSPSAPYDLPMQALVGLNPDSLTNLEVLTVR